MKQRFEYDTQLKRGDIIEIYCKTVVNLGPLNYFFEKSISYSTPNGGQSIVMYSSPLIGYIARQLMDERADPTRCDMERVVPFTKRGRKIDIRTIDNKVVVEVEDSARGLRKVKKALEQTFGVREKWKKEQQIWDEYQRTGDRSKLTPELERYAFLTED